MTDPVQKLLAAARQPGAPQVFLVFGDLVVAEPVAARLAAALAADHGGQVESHRRPASLASLLQDLRTFSLFGSAKVILAVDTTLFADRAAAADLIDDAEEALPSPDGRREGGGAAAAGGGTVGRKRSGTAAAAGAGRDAGRDGRPGAPDASGSGVPGGGGEGDGRPRLGTRERLAASRLMQVLRMFDIPTGGGAAAEAVVDQLPGWVLEGGTANRRARGGRGRGKRQVEELRAGLVELFERARDEDIAAGVEGDLSDLSAAISGGLPPGHAIVFAERQAAGDHPLVRLLDERGALAAVGDVEAGRGTAWQGVERLAAELAGETGVGITSDALAELARRTLRKAGDSRRGGGDAAQGGATGDSTARLAGEYRKLANLAGGGAPGARIDRRLVEEAVEDRGEEDVFKLLDAIGAGQGGEAMDRLRRLLSSADDPMAARLSLFALLATFCRRLTAIRGMMRLARVPAGEANYGRFAARLAPALQGDLAGGKNPLAGVNVYALHRAYLAACRIPEALAARLPWEVLETELRIKGDSAEADTALARLVIRLSTAAAAPPPASRRR